MSGIKRRMTLAEGDADVEDDEGDEADKISTPKIDDSHNKPPATFEIMNSFTPHPEDDEKVVQRKSEYSRIRDTINKKLPKFNSLEGDELNRLFAQNEPGFVKRKEIDMYKRTPIFGLNTFHVPNESEVF